MKHTKANGKVAFITGANRGLGLETARELGKQGIVVVLGSRDPKKGEALKAGGFIHMPKGMHHYGWASQETVVQINGSGPFVINYVNAADDPTKTR